MSGDEPTIEQTWERLRRFRAWIVATTFLGILGALAFASSTSRYTANSVLLVKRSDMNVLQALSSASVGMSLGFNGKDNYLDKFLVYLNSKNFFDAAAQDAFDDDHFSIIKHSLVKPRFAYLKETLNQIYPGLTAYRGEIRTVDDLARAIAASVRIGRGDSGTIIVTATAVDRRTAAMLANLVATSAVKNTIKAEVKEIDEAQGYILAKIGEIGNRLDLIREEMTSLGAKKGTISGIAGPALPTGADRLEAEIQASKLKFDANRKAIERLTKKLKERRELLVEDDAGGGIVKSYRLQILALKNKRSTLLAQGVNLTSPVVKAIDDELAETIARLKALPGGSGVEAEGLQDDDLQLEEGLKALERENSTLSDYLATAKGMLADLMSGEGVMTERQQRYGSLIKRTEVEHALLAELSKQLYLLDVQRISLRNKVSILETASDLDAARSPPLATLAFLGGAIGAIVAIFLTLARERSDPTVVGRRDLGFFSLKDLGSIPAINLRKKIKQATLENQFGQTAFTNPSEHASFWMGMKYIRTRLLRITGQLGSGVKVISVHSAMPSEGKTMTAYNLAEVIATTGKRVLLLDADILGSRMREILNLDPRLGLVGVLSGDVTCDEAIVSSVRKHLDLLPAGVRTSASTDLLSDHRFAAVLAELKKRYDYIVVDTPPANLVPDSAIIASYSDFSAFVVACYQTKLREVDEALRNLEQATNKPMYLLLNRVRKVKSRKRRYEIAYTSQAADETPPRHYDAAG